MNAIEALKRVTFLRALPDSVLAAIGAAGRTTVVAVGETVFEEHQRCLGLIVVLSGVVRVYSLDRRGREITIDRQEPGESVLELPLFDGGNCPASAVAAAPETRLFIVPRDAFLALMAAHPEIAAHALRGMAIRMRRLLAMLEAQALHTVQMRLAAYLLRTSAGRNTFRLEETNEAIASSIGTVREVVSRTLRSLKEQGAIDIAGRTVSVLDHEALVNTAQ